MSVRLATRHRRAGLALVMILVATVLALTGPMPKATAEPVPLPGAAVLILGSTVIGGVDSIEAQQVKARGLTPIVVDDATWASKTTGQFASYRAIVLGDPDGSVGAVAAAEANKDIWGPVVNGNVIIIGTDAVGHAGQGGDVLTRRGIDFAVDQVGKTGLFLSLSQYYDGAGPGTPVPVLDGIRPGGFSVMSPGCYNDAHIVATHPALTGLTDSTLSDWSCSVHEAFDTYPPDFQVLAMARNIGSTYTASDGTIGTPYILASGAGLRSFPLSLSPTSATAPTGGKHTVTAQLLDAATSKPVAGASVSFAIIDGPDVGTMGTCSSRLLCPDAGKTGTCSSGLVCSTDAAGQVSWTFTNSGSAGVDTIQAFLDKNANGTADIGEPQARAGMTWTSALIPVSTTTSKHGSGQLGVTCGQTKFDWVESVSGDPTFVKKGEEVCVFLLSNQMARRLLTIALDNDTTVANVFANVFLSELYGTEIVLDEGILSDYRTDNNEVKPYLSTATTAVPPVSRIMRGAEKATEIAISLTKYLLVKAIQEGGACVQVNTDIDNGKLYVDSIPVFNPRYASEEPTWTAARVFEKREKFGPDGVALRPLGMSCNEQGLAELKGTSAEVMAPSEQAIISAGKSAALPSDARTPAKLYAFGNKTEIKGLRPSDMPVSSDGTIGPTTDPRDARLQMGMSAFNDVAEAPLTGWYHSLAAGASLPKGIAVMADGPEVFPGSPNPRGHYTFYPTERMSIDRFNQLVKGMAWVLESNKKA